jgi:hypothetical protein
MRLNIHILSDELEDLDPETDTGSDTELDLAGVRAWHPGISLDPSYVYLIDGKNSHAVTSLDGPGSFVVLDEAGELSQPFGKDGLKVICLRKPRLDYDYVFMRLQSIFERFAIWKEDVLMSSMGSESLQRVFDKAASVLRNPIALIDKSQILVIKAGVMPDDIAGSIWLELTSQGYARLENLSKNQLNEFNEKLSGTEEPFFLQKVSRYRDNYHMIAPLHNGGKCFAMFGMSDLNGPITLGQVSLVKLLQDLMKRIILSEIGKQHLGSHVDYYIDRILQGYLVEQGALAYSLALRRWEIGDAYQALFLRADDPAAIDDSLRSAHAMRMQNLIPDSHVFPYDQGTLILVRSVEDTALSNYLPELEQVCESFGLYCGVSLVHTGFMQIREAYTQARAALEFGRGSEEGRTLLFQKHYVTCLADTLGSTVDISCFCHPKVLRLWLRGGEKGRTLVEALRCYLVHGRNTNATARALGLHRNTVIYRIERLRELLGDDLDSTDASVHLMLVLSCLFVDHVKAHRRVSVA